MPTLYYETYKDSYLCHHGIKGQKWGVQNGPPYPLGQENHSRAEKQAANGNTNNKKSATSESSQNAEKKHLTDGQKKAIAIGAAVTATALVAVGGYALYKSGKLDNIIKAGSKAVLENTEILIDDYIKEYVDSNDLISTRICIANSFMFDKSGTEAKHIFSYIESNNPHLIEKHKNLTPFITDYTLLDNEYAVHILADIKQNLSKERFEHLANIMPMIK